MPFNISDALIKRTLEYVKQKMAGEHTGHDWFHIERVCEMAKQIQAVEGGDLKLINMAALLHDLGDYKQYGFSELKGSFVLRGMMDVLEIDHDLKETLVKIIDEAQFKGDDTATPSSIEAKILQDSDWLDSLGALGIARTFATGGNGGRPIHVPSIKPRQKLSKTDYIFKKNEGTSINYFYEKILKIPKMLNTKTAKKIGEERARFVEIFLDEFINEWDCKK
jgi:uncharacterized protein